MWIKNKSSEGLTLNFNVSIRAYKHVIMRAYKNMSFLAFKHPSTHISIPPISSAFKRNHQHIQVHECPTTLSL